MSPKRALSGGSAALAALVLIALFAVPAGRAAAQSVELRPSLTVAQDWDSNVFSREQPELDSWVTRTSPRLGLVVEDEGGRLELDLGLNFRNYRSYSEIDSTDQDYTLRGLRKLSDRFQIELDGRHRVLDQRDDIFEEFGDDPDFLIQSERPDVIYDEAAFTARYMLTPRATLIGRTDFERREYDDNVIVGDTIRDLDTASAGLSVEYMLSPLDRLGLGGSFSRSDQDPASSASSIPDQRDDMATLQLNWVRSWSPKWTSTASIGQRWIRAERYDVPRLISTDEIFFQGVDIDGDGNVDTLIRVAGTEAVFADESDRSSGVIGSIDLVRALPRGELRFGYSRDARTGGAGATTSSSIEIDSMYARWVHDLTDRIKLTLTGSYSDYESIGEFDQASVVLVDEMGRGSCAPGAREERVGGSTDLAGISCLVEAESEIDLEQLRLDLNLDWRVRRDLTTFFRFSFVDQDSKGTQLQTFDRHRFTVGFRYVYDPE